MSIYQIEVDDRAIINEINAIIGTVFSREIKSKYSDTADVISLAVKEIVYARKDEIIEQVVDRATKEIVRKGLPKLLERYGG